MVWTAAILSKTKYNITTNELIIYLDLAVDCGNLINPVNGVVELTGTTEGSSATYRCLSGFNLFGTSQRICQNNGFWSGVPPVCQRSEFTQVLRI